MPVKHSVNPGQLVQAVFMHTENTQKTHTTLTYDLETQQEVAEVHVHAKCHQAECSGSRVIALTKKTATMQKNNTATSSAGGN